MLGVKEKKIVALAALAITLTSLIITMARGFLTGIYQVISTKVPLTYIENLFIAMTGIAFVTVFLLVKDKKTLACSLILGGIVFVHIVFCLIMMLTHSYSDAVWINSLLLTLVVTGSLLLVAHKFAVKYRAAEEQEKANAAENKESAE